MQAATDHQTVTLRNTSTTGEQLEATFAPSMGMNLLSFKKGSCEVIDQSTRPLFDERFAGLGALIGPHFHRRNPKTLPSIANEDRFPHIARVRANGVADPFSHGIARYAPWTATSSEQSISAVLSGRDAWNEMPISELEGQNFKMRYDAELEPGGLKLKLSIVSDSDSLVGIHFYYRLPNGQGTVTSDARPIYRDTEGWKDITDAWNYDQDKHQLTWDLGQEADYGFKSFYQPLGGEILLQTQEYGLKTEFYTGHEEQSWQLFHPEGASFVCIEPMTAANPRKPCLTVSNLEIKLSIL